MAELQGILLESGTNEMELLEFFIGKQSFGVNVAKIRQMVQFRGTKLTKVPYCHKFVLGSLLWMNSTIPLIDLSIALGREPVKHDGVNTTVLVTEFNDRVNSFLVDGVNRIHRISWKNIEPAGDLLSQWHVPISGSVNVEGTDILIVDMEQIVVEINPQNGPQRIEHQDDERKDQSEHDQRASFKIVFAEDSPTIRDTIVHALMQSGYDHVDGYPNGRLAYQAIKKAHQQAQEANQSIKDYVDILITDIEMPQMDGLTLCKRIKTEVGQDLPVIIFSSLITDEMSRKCKKVGADANVAKSRIDQLIKMLDQMHAKGSLAQAA